MMRILLFGCVRLVFQPLRSCIARLTSIWRRVIHSPCMHWIIIQSIPSPVKRRLSSRRRVGWAVRTPSSVGLMLLLELFASSSPSHSVSNMPYHQDHWEICELSIGRQLENKPINRLSTERRNTSFFRFSHPLVSSPPLSCAANSTLFPLNSLFSCILLAYGCRTSIFLFTYRYWLAPLSTQFRSFAFHRPQRLFVFHSIPFTSNCIGVERILSTHTHIQADVHCIHF